MSSLLVVKQMIFKREKNPRKKTKQNHSKFYTQATLSLKPLHIFGSLGELLLDKSEQCLSNMEYSYFKYFNFIYILNNIISVI